MYIATTPKFTFTVGLDTANISTLLLTFRQDGVNVVELTESDVTMSGNSIDVVLTQEQTLLFHVGKASAQIRAKLTDGSVEASNPIEITISETFNVEILQ